MGAQEDLEAAMQEEQSKGPGSTVPEDTLAGISLSKDLISGEEPFTRESFARAISGELGNIKQKKADIYQRLQSGASLTSSQTVGLGILALGLMAAGGLAKGKRGLAAAGDAFNVGGQVFLKQNENKREADQAAAKSELSALNSQEASLTKQGIENKMAPIKTEESIGARIKARAEMVKRGLVKTTGDSTTINMPDAKVTERLENAQDAAYMINKFEELLADKFKDELREGESWISSASRIAKGKFASEGAQKELNAMIAGFQRANAKALGANPSNMDLKLLLEELTGGSVYSIPFLAERLSSLKDDAQQKINTILDTHQKLKGGGGYDTAPELIGGKPRSPGPQGVVVTLKDGTKKTLSSKQEAIRLREQGLL